MLSISMLSPVFDQEGSEHGQIRISLFQELLRRILKNSKDIQDYLLVFYLERGLYHEASSMTKEMRSSGKWQNLRSNLLQSNEDRRLSKRVSL